MDADIDRILIPRDAIARRVGELARQIVDDLLQSPDPSVRKPELTIVPILTGAMIFCGDLIRQIRLPIRIGLLAVSSYPGQSVRAQGANFLGQQLGDLSGRHVLLIDDILDSGGTLRLVVPVLQSLNPASVKTCVLLRKDRQAARETPVDYVGFEIPDEFVVGYGLDYDDYYRNLPEIVTLKKSVFAAAAAPAGGTE